MDFGKLLDISKVDFKMPELRFHPEVVLGGIESESFEVYVGCPIWANKNWVNKIYPSQAKEKEFLKYYAQQFNTIELNVTHYQIPDLKTIERWKYQVEENPDFKFCPKIPQEISHHQVKKGTFHKLTELFCHHIDELGENLGMTFLQLSPHFTPQQIDLLEDFLIFYPEEIPLAVEFRHPDWFKENRFDLAAKLLEKYQRTSNLTDVSGRRDVLHMRLTSKTLFLRFVGNDLHPTDYERVEDWVRLIVEWQKIGLEKVYFFAHEPENDTSPELCDFFIQKLNQALELNLKTPQIRNVAQQGSLF